MAFNFNIMKKTLFITFLFMSIGLYSQGNLQFNRVVNLEYNKVLKGTSSSASDTGENLLETLTIPENKVWKIVSASITAGDRIRGNNPLYTVSSQNDIGLFIGGTKIIHNQTQHNPINLPIWIASGTRNLTAYMTSSQDDPIFFSISIIEFNIVN